MSTARALQGSGSAAQGTVVQLVGNERSEGVQPVSLMLMHLAALMASLPFFGPISALLVLAPLIGTLAGLALHSRALARYRGPLLESWLAVPLVLLLMDLPLLAKHLGASYGSSAFGLLPVAGLILILVNNLAILRPTPTRLSAMAASISVLLLVQLAINQGLMRSLYAAIVFFVVWASLASRRTPARRTNGTPQGGGRWIHLGFGMRTAGWTLLVSLPLMVAFFVLFPRLPLDALRSQRSDQQMGSTGLSDSLTLGSISELQKSEEPAFTATFRNKAPSGGSLYWRAAVLDRLDGQRWISMISGRGPTPVVPGLMDISGAPMPYTTLLDSANRTQMVATLEGTAGRAYASFEENTLAMTMRPDGTYSIIQTARAIGSPNFQIQSVAATAYEQTRLSAPNPTDPTIPADMKVWTELAPGFNPRTQAFGRALRQRMGSDDRFIAEVLRMIGEEPYRYTLRPPALGEQAIDEFFLETRAGFCEHYASAFVVLMRAAGIPARLVTGYLSTGAKDGKVLVSQGDAHAWTEVWSPAGGWVRQDPTASISPLRVDSDATNARLDATPEGFWGFLDVTWRRNTGRAEAFWRETMLDFDAGSQERIFSKLGLDTIGKPLLAAVAILLMAGLAVAWQYLRGLVSLGSRHRNAGRLERLLERKARQGGIERKPWQTWRQALNEAGPNLQGKGASDFARIVAEYERLTYGLSEPDNAQRVRALRHLRHRIQAWQPRAA